MSFKPKTESARKYAESLRDPRWISRREKILQRDNHTCRGCGSRDPEPLDDDGYEDLDPPEKVLLEVHHKYYEWGNQPWDYPDSCLITLCQMCHDTETAYSKEATQRLTRVLQTRFLSKDMFKLAHAFECLAMPFKEHKKAADIITWILTERQILGSLEQIYDDRKTTLRSVGELSDGLIESIEDFNNG